MGAGFFHGIKINEFYTGPLPITTVPSAVVGLVGSAPMWALPGALQLWDPSWHIAAGVQCIDANGNVQTCTVAGTTGTAAPTWATTLNSTTASDGTATWKLTALKGANGRNVNLATLINGAGGNPASPTSSAAFGPLIQGYTIPYALAAIFAQGSGQAIVVNVFDQTTHVTTITLGSYTFPATGPQVINLGHMGVSGVLVKNGAGSTTYVQGTDFTVDHVNGLITALGSGAITSNEAMEITLSYADPSKITDANLIGAITSGVYTGMQNWLLAYQQIGFFPTILIAPAYSAAAGMQSAGSADQTVAAALTTMAGLMRSIAIVDAPPATQVATAINNRGSTGNTFDTQSDRVILCYPNQLFTDLGLVPTGVVVNPSGIALQVSANAVVDGPYSHWVAGVMVATDAKYGYWYSPSNKPIVGPLGPDVSVYWSPFDPNCDVNNLNAAGIVTIASSFATGLVVWGNRSAAYPTITTPDNFISVRRTMDVIEQSVQRAMYQFLDQPISSALIDAILASCNAFLRTLIQTGALVDGAASYNPAENPVVNIEAGQLVIDVTMMPPPPAEQITFNFNINANLLSAIGATTAAASNTNS